MPTTRRKAGLGRGLSGYGSAIDWPTARYWRALSGYYPKAKILLTVPSPESWYQSFSQTILNTIGPGNDPLSFGVKVIREVIFSGHPDDRDHAIAVYNNHNSEAQAAFPPDRLLTYELGQGWEPMCKFFGKPVPEVPFPQSNTTDEFRVAILN